MSAGVATISPWVKCSDVIDVRDGTHDTPKPIPTGVPLITSKNLTPAGIDFSDVTFISPEDHRKISVRSRVSKGDILFAMIGTIGNPVIVDGNSDFSIKNVALFKFGASKVCNRYFKHLLHTPLIQRQLAIAARGGNQRFVSLSALRNLTFPLPPLEEQKRIAAILDKADAIRRKREQAIKLADEFLRSLFLDMFGDPVTNPKGWPITRVRNYLSAIEAGTSVSGEERQPALGEFAVLKVSAVTWGNFRPHECKVVPSEAVPPDKISPKTGDLLFSRANTRQLVGATCVVPRDYPNLFLPDKIWRLTCRADAVTSPFLHHVFSNRRYRSELAKVATGTSGSMLNISQDKLLEARVPQPPLTLVKHFSEIATRFQKVAERLRSHAVSDDSLANCLSRHAFGKSI